VSGDSRGWRIALLPDSVVNPLPDTHAKLPDVMALLEANGYGVLQLPPPGEHPLLLAVIVDQVAEYAHHGYAVVAIGVRGDEASDGLHWRRLAPLLRHRGVPLPPRHIIRANVDSKLEAQRLNAFLDSYDLPSQEQQRWRGRKE
jgi:hypothetical protein